MFVTLGTKEYDLEIVNALKVASSLCVMKALEILEWSYKSLTGEGNILSTAEFGPSGRQHYQP